MNAHLGIHVSVRCGEWSGMAGRSLVSRPSFLTCAVLIFLNLLVLIAHAYMEPSIFRVLSYHGLNGG